jgi:hypothetical protein
MPQHMEVFLPHWRDFTNPATTVKFQPSVQSLQFILFTIFDSFEGIYIVLDALDECTERKDLLKWIKQMTSWKRGKLHLLTTNRPEEDIAKNLRLLDPDYVDIKQDLITRDVKRYIDCILDGEDAFDRWNDEIKETRTRTRVTHECDTTGFTLLEKGADINTQGGEYGNALQAASLDGHEAIAG